MSFILYWRVVGTIRTKMVLSLTEKQTGVAVFVLVCYAVLLLVTGSYAVHYTLNVSGGFALTAGLVSLMLPCWELLQLLRQNQSDVSSPPV